MTMNAEIVSSSSKLEIGPLCSAVGLQIGGGCRICWGD